MTKQRYGLTHAEKARIAAIERLVVKTPEYAAWLDRQRSEEAERLVYIFQSGPGGMIKIGHSRNIPKRMHALQMQSPVPLRLLGWMPGGQAQEFRLHFIFRDSRAWGEWFNPTPELLAYTLNDMQHSPPPVAETNVWNHELQALDQKRAQIRREYDLAQTP